MKQDLLHAPLFHKYWLFCRRVRVLTRQAELGVHPTVAFYLANFYVGDVCELVCHRDLHAPFQFHKLNSVVLKLKEMLKVAFCV
jgi:hypothetical protein